MSRRFHDRTDAGRRLAQGLTRYAEDPNVIVLALPRGGVPVGAEVAAALRVPLDVFVVRKLGVPGHEELAMGAVASGGHRFLNEDLLLTVGLSRAQVDEVTDRERETVAHQEELYRSDREPHRLERATVILVDDGLATGATMRAAVRALRSLSVGRIVMAVPVAPPQACAALAPEVDEIVCPLTPEPFTAVGMWYEDFSPVSDEQVRKLLASELRGSGQ